MDVETKSEALSAYPNYFLAFIENKQTCKEKCHYWFQPSTLPTGVWDHAQVPSHYFLLTVSFRLFYLLLSKFFHSSFTSKDLSVSRPFFLH